MTFPLESWALIENRAETFDLDGRSYVSSAIKLGTFIVERYWQNQQLGQNTVVCIHEHLTDTTHLAYPIEEDWLAAPSTEKRNEIAASVDAPLDLVETNPLDAEGFVESEILLADALPSLVQIPLDSDDLEAIMFNATALSLSAVDYLSWCIKMRCHYDISVFNGFSMIVNDSASSSVTEIHLI